MKRGNKLQVTRLGGHTRRASHERSLCGKKKNSREWLMVSDGYDERDYYVAGTLMSDEAWSLIPKKHGPVRPVGAGDSFQPVEGFEDLRFSGTYCINPAWGGRERGRSRWRVLLTFQFVCCGFRLVLMICHLVQKNNSTMMTTIVIQEM